MTIFYSPSLKGFYDSDIHTASKIPADVIAITTELHATLLMGLNSGGSISFDSAGQPVVIPRSDADTLALNAASARAKRTSLIAQTDWSQGADIPQTTRDKFTAYRQALRDVPQQPGFPTTITWPTLPE